MGVTDEAWKPSAEWRAAYEQQATDALFESATKYADKFAHGVGRATRRSDPLYARELVQDALIDTFDGTLRWQPERVSLLQHVYGVVKSRSRHHRLRAVRMPMRSLDDSADDHSTEGRPIEREASMAANRERSGPPQDEAMTAHADQVVGELKRLLPANDDAHTMMNAYAAGKTEKAEVMALTGMSSATYHNQRRRLARLAQKLPETVREPILEALRSRGNR